MSIHRFVIDRLTDEARLAQHVASQWAHEQPPRQHDMPVSTFINRYDPSAIMRAVEAARDIVDRHHPASEKEQHLHYETSPGRACVGCGDYSDDMGGIQWNVEDIEDCPELRALAWRWNHLQGWDSRWCLHLTTKNVNATSFEDRVRGAHTYIKVCRRCDQQIGDLHEEPRVAVRKT